VCVSILILTFLIESQSITAYTQRTFELRKSPQVIT